MCTLALYFQTFPGYPVVVAANRDEYLNRPSAPPCALQRVPWIFGGKDLQAGGTWLGVNQYGLLAGLLNRHTPEPNDPARRSRGLLSLDALQTSSAAEAAARIGHNSLIYTLYSTQTQVKHILIAQLDQYTSTLITHCSSRPLLVSRGSRSGSQSDGFSL